MLGDTGVAVHPEDERYSDLVGPSAILPLVGRRIPIVADEYADPETGSGAVKITPAHDFNDFEVGRRHGLEMINVLDADGAGHQRQRVPKPIAASTGTRRAKRVVADLEAARGLVEKIEPHPHTVPHGDRSDMAIEPWLTDQWYCDAATLAQPAIEAVEDGRTVFVPKQWENTYFEWMRNIQPWCISRQLWWGHQIPAWYGPDGKVFVEETRRKRRGRPRPLRRARSALRRDEDVLDTWFSSGPVALLDPGLARADPGAGALLPDHGAGHRLRHHLLLGRPDDDDGPALHGRGAVPPRLHPRPRPRRARHEDVQVQGQRHRSARTDRRLRRRRAALHPDRLAPRAATSSSAASRVEGYRNFVTKLWNAARFCQMNEACARAGFDPRGCRQPLNRWIVGETRRPRPPSTGALEAYRFNDAAAASTTSSGTVLRLVRRARQAG